MGKILCLKIEVFKLLQKQNCRSYIFQLIIKICKSLKVIKIKFGSIKLSKINLSEKIDRLKRHRVQFKKAFNH